MNDFTHINKNNDPGMVDVSEKKITHRIATAISSILLTPEIMKAFRGDEIQTKKGPVFQTAILAGTMAVKKTADLIPLCHTLPIEKCEFNLTTIDNKVEIRCTVKTTGKTGVEMEALTGASVAALTIYDMCKAMSHDMVIYETRLLKKTGGKSDFTSNA